MLGPRRVLVRRRAPAGDEREEQRHGERARDAADHGATSTAPASQPRALRAGDAALVLGHQRAPVVDEAREVLLALERLREGREPQRAGGIRSSAGLPGGQAGLVGDRRSGERAERGRRDESPVALRPHDASVTTL